MRSTDIIIADYASGSRISYVASRKIRLILDDFATILHQPWLGFLDARDGHLQDRAQLDE